jgi:hypothetical protein
MKKFHGAVPRTIEFSTSDGLDRHLQAQHESAMYSCTAVGCFKGTSATKFQKTETLTQHIKESHGPGVMFSCPSKTCTFEPSKLDDVAIHAHWMHTTNPSKIAARGWRHRLHDATIDAMINAASWNYFRCPIWNCRKFVSGGHRKVNAHLLAHLPIELEKVQDELASDGYEIRYAPIDIAIDISAPHTISIHIKCPACGVRCEDETSFRDHFEAIHMIAKSLGVLEHFKTWKEDVTSCSTNYFVKELSSRPCWLERVANPESYKLRASCDTSLKCSYPTCSFALSKEETSHPSFLRPANEIVQELWSHRIKILRHFPQFITYLMFNEQYLELESIESSTQGKWD